jgi:hypothetical protein
MLVPRLQSWLLLPLCCAGVRQLLDVDAYVDVDDVHVHVDVARSLTVAVAFVSFILYRSLTYCRSLSL